ncbi:MAG: aminopeptidase, partial [Muribaculaceae bacterium]|nr:aminopeptidase [Muribaculaceae bacterium]
MKKKIAYLFSILYLAAGATSASGQAVNSTGKIDENLLNRFRTENSQPDQSSIALKNAMNATDINTLAASASKLSTDDNFTYRVKSKDITDQKRSGRCWLFTGLNMLRGQAINQHNLGGLKLSQVYNFFYDQLEKSNLFLQEVIDSRDVPFDDRRVEFLFNHPLSDGGTFMGVSDLVMKYGVVPDGVMP